MSLNGAREVMLKVGFNTTDLKRGTNEIRTLMRSLQSEVRGIEIPVMTSGMRQDTSNIKALRNELSGLRNTFVSGGIAVNDFQRDLTSLRSRATEAALGLDRTSSEFVQLTGVAAGATRELERVERQLDRVNREANQNRAAGGLRTTVATDTGLGGYIRGGVGNVIAGLGAAELARTGVELVRTGDSIRRTEIALNAYSTNARRDLEIVKEATAGMATEFESAALATTILQNKLATNEGQLRDLAEAASLLGSRKGVSPLEFINTLNQAQLNNSTDLLDNLGISSSAAAARIDELKKSGLSANEAFKAGVYAQIASEVQLLRDAGYGGASGMDALTVAGRDFRDGIGVGLSEIVSGLTTSLGGLNEVLGIAPLNWRLLGEETLKTVINMSGVGPAIAGTTQGLQAATASLREYTTETERKAQASFLLQQAEASVADTLRQIPLDDTRAQTALVASAFLDAGYAAGYTNQQLIELWAATGGTQIELGLMGDKAISTAAKVQQVGIAAYNSAQDVWALKDAIDALNNSRTGNYGRTGAVSGRIAMDPRSFQERRAGEVFGADIGLAGGTPEYFQTTKASVISTANRNLMLMDDYNGTYAPDSLRTTGGAGGAARAAGARAGQALGESFAQAAIQEMDSAISGAMDLGIGVSRNQSLMALGGIYEEQFNEAGRQLEDIINRGGESEFASKFFSHLLGDETQLKAAAAQLQDDIAQFLRPDLLNYDALLREAEENLLGSRNKKAIMERVREDLIGKGYGAGEIDPLMGLQSAAALDSTAMAAASTENATKLALSMSQALNTAMNAEAAGFKQAGRSALDNIVAGALEGVEGGSPSLIVKALRDYIATYTLNQIAS